MQAVPTDYRHVLFMKRAISALLAARPGQRHLTFYQLKNSVFATLSGVVTFKKYKMIRAKNLNDIIKLNNYVRSKINSICV